MQVKIPSEILSHPEKAPLGQGGEPKKIAEKEWKGLQLREEEDDYDEG